MPWYVLSLWRRTTGRNLNRALVTWLLLSTPRRRDLSSSLRRHEHQADFFCLHVGSGEPPGWMDDTAWIGREGSISLDGMAGWRKIVLAEFTIQDRMKTSTRKFASRPKILWIKIVRSRTKYFLLSACVFWELFRRFFASYVREFSTSEQPTQGRYSAIQQGVTRSTKSSP